MNVHEVKAEQPEPTVKTPDRTTGAPEADVVQSSGPPSGSSPHLREFDGRAQADTDKRVDKDSTELVSSDEPRHVIAGRGGAGGAMAPYRPHITERPLRRIDAFYLPRAQARTAIVIVTGKSGPTPVGPDGRPTKGEIFWSGGTLYEVDLGLHHTTVELDLPAKTNSSDFHLTAFVEWRVVKPAKVVADNVRDVREALSIALRIRLRSVTPEFDVSEVVAAEAVVKEEIKHPDLGRTYGLETTIIPRLTVDERARAYASTQRELERELAIEELRHRNKKREEEHEQQRQRARIAEYRDIVASGNIDQFALQLASNPQDVAEVVKLAREERNEERKQFIDLVARLFQSGAVDRWDIDDQVQLVLKWLAESTKRIIRSDVITIPEQRTAATKVDQTANGKFSKSGVPDH